MIARVVTHQAKLQHIADSGGLQDLLLPGANTCVHMLRMRSLVRLQMP